MHHFRLVTPSPETAHERFRAVRQVYHLAFLDWLRQRPASEDVELELDASVAVLRQIAVLATERGQRSILAALAAGGIPGGVQP